MAKIGLVGTGVMGKSLILNMAEKGISVACYNIDPEAYVRPFVEGAAKGLPVTGAYSPAEFVGLLETPRAVMLMVPAGDPVDEVLAWLLPLLEPGDAVVDGGNSHFPDTSRRLSMCGEKGVHYIGMGVSGGEEGARRGPCLMPGGDEAGWPIVKDIFQKICARAEDGAPCCDWMGDGGAGHFVKMVHNGVEYGDMQLICEAYHLMRAAGMTQEAMADTFADWNRRELSSYLIEITADILRKKDEDGGPLLPRVLDAAGQKGTGKWTGISALEEAVPLTLIGEAVFARCLSADREGRLAAAQVLPGPHTSPADPAFLTNLFDALYLGKVISYAQGFILLRAAAKHYGWKLHYDRIARVWRGGCIIRSRFLGDIAAAFERDGELNSLLTDPFFADACARSQQGLRQTVSRAALSGIPVPAMSAALSYYDGYRCEQLPANLLQAQRDCFGAHTFERTDRPRGEKFHVNWQ